MKTNFNCFFDYPIDIAPQLLWKLTPLLIVKIYGMASRAVLSIAWFRRISERLGMNRVRIFLCRGDFNCLTRFRQSLLFFSSIKNEEDLKKKLCSQGDKNLVLLNKLALFIRATDHKTRTSSFRTLEYRSLIYRDFQLYYRIHISLWGSKCEVVIAQQTTT